MSTYELDSIGDNQSILIVSETPQNLTLEILRSKPEIQQGIITTKHRDLFESQAYRANIDESYNEQKHKELWVEKAKHKTQTMFIVFDDFEQDCFHVFPSMRPYVLFNRSYSLTSIVSLRKASRLSPNIRCSFDIVFLSKCADQEENKMMHDRYFRDVCQITQFLEYLTKYEYLVLHLHKHEMNLSFYKTLQS